MTVHVRFFAAAAFAALTSAAAPLAAQSSARLDVRDVAPTFSPMGIVPIGIVPISPVDSTTAARAQSTTDAPATTIIRGPSVASARVAQHAISSTRTAPLPVIQNRTSNRNSVALMIVGGAALVVGAVIGDDAGTLVMLGGAGIGLYGLYKFLT
jgi:hypothetical protein